MKFNTAMAAYSLDLRKRIVDAVEQGDKTKREIANIFGVHESFIYKLLRQKRERGDIAPLPHGGGAEAKLNEEHLNLLSELVAKSPDAILEELREQMMKQGKVDASITTIWRALDELNLSLKKSRSEPRKPIRPKEQGSKGNKRRSR